MNTETGRRQDSAPTRPMALAVAVIALVLHWSAPDIRKIATFFGAPGAALGFSDIEVVQPGTLPRVMPRGVSLQNSLPRSSEHSGQSGERFPVLLAAIAQTEAGYVTVPAPGTPSAAPRIFVPRAFDARAPPAPAG